MDDLDRLYFEFVETLRRERPSALTEPLTVAELHELVIPYRRVRNPVGFRSNDDYEAALTRLLSGERGYVLSDRDIQEELKAGLNDVVQDTCRYRAFPDARVWLNPEEIPPPGDIRYAPPELREQVDWLSQATAGPDQPGEPQSGADVASVDEPATGAVPGAESRARPESALGDCARCGVSPPEGAAFCPYCGSRLSADRCRNCGADMEPAWRFCADCGAPRDRRSADSA
jgi:hypothetical protein